MDITSYLLGKKASGGGGSGTKNGYTGHYDSEGLAQIGWTADDIQYYQDNGVRWNEELDDSYKLLPDELQGEVNNNVRFLPKTSTQNSYAYYSRMIGLPYVTINNTSWNGIFRGCYNLITIPLIDTSKVTIMQSAFDGCYNLRSIPLLDTKKVTTMQSMFSACYNLEKVPLLDTLSVDTTRNMFQYCMSLRSIPQFDTKNVTNMSNMFNGCASLIDVPVLNTSKVTNLQGIFGSCYCLSDESINNILQMCINATAYESTKTLAYLGFQSTNYPTSRIQALSNYQDFIDAGWTIGY